MIPQEWKDFFASLTPAEMEVVRFLVYSDGTAKDMSRMTHMSERTIRTHLTNIYSKAWWKVTRASLVKMALISGVVSANRAVQYFKREILDE